MRTKVRLGVALGVLSVGIVGSMTVAGGRGSGPIVYVTGQGLFYDSVVVADLPQRGRFQQLEMAGPSPDGLQTEFGPGDVGYLGGRWWVDVNGNDQMDGDDAYFACPLLGPGREEP